VPAGELDALRDQILLLLQRYAAGPKPIRVQLSVCLAILAIQMKDWINVLPDVVAALSSSSESHAAILDFLRVLPEEVTEGRKITLSEEDLTARTQALLGDNAENVVQLLSNYAQSSREFFSLLLPPLVLLVLILCALQLLRPKTPSLWNALPPGSKKYR
jgi:transportin-3